MDAEERKVELMSQNKMEGLMFKMDYDPRIIGSEKKDKNGNPKGIGNFIRKTSLDEFPQFWNVLKGDMSLVGTRPPTVDEWEQYELHHRSRMSIKPGITGMWQAREIYSLICNACSHGRPWLLLILKIFESLSENRKGAFVYRIAKMKRSISRKRLKNRRIH